MRAIKGKVQVSTSPALSKPEVSPTLLVPCDGILAKTLVVVVVVDDEAMAQLPHMAEGLLTNLDTPNQAPFCSCTQRHCMN